MTTEGNKPPKDDRHDPLDRLLADASWREPAPGGVQRLQERWRALSTVRTPKSRLTPTATGIAIAACLLGAMLVLWLLPRPVVDRDQDIPGADIARSDPIALPEVQRPDRVVEDPPEPDAPVLAANEPRRPVRSRPPTALETVAFYSMTRVGHASSEANHQEMLDEAIGRYVSDPQADLDELSAPLMAARSQCLQELVWRIAHSSGAKRAAAIELLGRLGDRGSLPLLIQLVRSKETHSPAVQALVRLADSDMLGQLASIEEDVRLKQEILAALLARQDRRSMAVYLNSVCTRATSEAALAALVETSKPPVGLLFEFFDSPQQKQRYAAAVALGRLGDPEIPRRLIRMVAADVRRREALTALVASSDRAAVSFVTLAQRDSALAGPVHEARYRVGLMTP